MPDSNYGLHMVHKMLLCYSSHPFYNRFFIYYVVLLLEKIVISNLLIVSAKFCVLHLLFENILNFIKYFYTIRK